MAKSPEERHPSCRELVADLRHVLGTAAVETYADRTINDSVPGGPPTQTAKTVLQAIPRGRDRRLRNWWLLAALALLLGGAAAAVGYALGNGGEPQSTPTRRASVAPPPPPTPQPPLSPAQRLLQQNIPPQIRRKCEPAEPPSPDFVASVVCRPGGGIIKVQYSRPESGARNNRYFDKRVRAEQTLDPGSLAPGVNCHSPPPIREWRSVGNAGHRPGPHTIGGRGYQGRFICYPSSWWAAIEWTDARVDVYAVAYGREIGPLFRWWKSKPGPIRSS